MSVSKSLLLLLPLVGACRSAVPSLRTTPADLGVPEAARSTDARLCAQTLEAFLAAAEARNFPKVYGLLSADLQGRYTPDRLEKDFAAEPLASERLARARAAVGQPCVLKEGSALLPLGAGKAVRLVKEPAGYRIAELE